MKTSSLDIPVVVVSSDPFFCLAAQVLLSLDRSIRIDHIVQSLEKLPLVTNNAVEKLPALVCDLDTIAAVSDFYEKFDRLIEGKYYSKVICLAEGNLEQVSHYLGNRPISGLLSKHDIGFSLHLAVRAVVEYNAVILTPNSHKFIEPGTFLHVNGKVIASESADPRIGRQIQEIVMWRALLGPDNSTIQDDLLLESCTAQAYVSQAYKLLGVDNDEKAFEALSDWWWQSRFYPVIE